MQKVNLKLVSVICEPVLSTPIVELIQELGATGFTLTEVRGQGSSERGSGEVPDLKTKIEILAPHALGDQLMKEISGRYFEDYSVIVYSTEATVLRAEKF